MERVKGVWIAVTLLLASACARPAADAHRYALQGRVLEVEKGESRARVAHQDIPGFMPAMTMTFAVHDPAAAAELRPGDAIRAVLVVTDDESWLEKVEIVARGLPVPEAPATVRPEPQIGALAPDVHLVDQDGQPLRLRDLRGSAVALTFIFTRCPLPDYCPRMSQQFAEVERRLAARPELRAATRLVSVSFDAEHDTPEVLTAYARRYTRPPFRHWRFASGDPAEVRRLADFVGLEYQADEGSFVHNLRTAVIDPQGRLAALFRGNGWEPGALLDSLAQAEKPGTQY
jgi:protein SCO1/2